MNNAEWEPQPPSPSPWWVLALATQSVLSGARGWCHRYVNGELADWCCVPVGARLPVTLALPTSTSSRERGNQSAASERFTEPGTNLQRNRARALMLQLAEVRWGLVEKACICFDALWLSDSFHLTLFDIQCSYSTVQALHGHRWTAADWTVCSSSREKQRHNLLC